MVVSRSTDSPRPGVAAPRAKRHAWAGCVVLLSVLSLAGSVRADETSAANQDLARSVAITGREAFNAGDYETAATLFRRAYALFPAPTVVLYEARSLEKLGRWIEALEAYQRTTQMPIDAASPAQFAEAVDAARAEGQELRAHIPLLTVQVTGASVNDPNLRVEINGRAIGAAQLGHALSLNPGTYRIAGSLSAERRAEASTVLEKGTRATIVLDLAPPELQAPGPLDTPAEAHSSSRVPVLAYVAGGIGVAGMAGGVVSGLVSSAQHSRAEDECGSDHQCDTASGTDAVNAFRTWRTVSTVSYGIGVAGLAAGVLLWLTHDGSPAPEQAALEPWVGPSTAGVRGTF